MGKYRKRPVVVEAEPFRLGLEDGWAFRWPSGMLSDHSTGGNAPATLRAKLADMEASGEFAKDEGRPAIVPIINTAEGCHVIGADDWVITGMKGERYPCKPDIFAATYDPA